MITLLAALAIPTVTATYFLARKRSYKPRYRPGGPLPRRQPMIERPTTPA